MNSISNKVLLFVVLTSLSYVLNTTTLTIYYGVHFLFGSIPLLLLLKKLGVWPALLGAVIAQSYTVLIWNHPFALIIFSLEILFLGLCFRKKVPSLILRDVVYWLLIGIPLVYVFYGVMLGFEMSGATLVALKDMMNGLINVWVAEIIYFVYRLLSNTFSRKRPTFYFTMKEVISYIGGGLLLLLSIFIVMIIGFYEQEKDEALLITKAEDKLEEVSRYYESWLSQKVMLHRNWIAQEPPPEGAQTVLFTGTFSFGDQGRKLSTNMPVELGYTTNGDAPLLEITTTHEDGTWTSRHPLSSAEAYILNPLNEQDMHVTFLNSNGEVLFTNNESFSLEEISIDSGILLREMGEGIVKTSSDQMAAMQQWKLSKFILTGGSMQGGTNFVIAASFRPLIDYQLMNQALAIILAFTIISLLLGEWISGTLLSHFEHLSRTTSRVVEALPHVPTNIEFPSSKIYEYHTLVRNFQILIHEWNEKYNASHETNIMLLESKKELEASKEKLEYLAHYDPLTHLPNRRQFTKDIDRFIADQVRFGLLFLDLDDFKAINDQFGHEAGDQFLQKIAERLNLAVKNGHVYRLSGDEFTVLIEHVQNRLDLYQLCETITKQLDDPIILNQYTAFARASIGIALFPDDATDRHTILKIADHAMYRSKRNGRNQASW